MKTEIFYLSNGLPVIYVNNPASKLAYVNLAINTSAKDETPEISGLAHAVEHFVFMGSKNYSDEDIRNISANYGSFIDGATDIDTTSFSFRVLLKNLEPMLKLLADVIINPIFPIDKIRSEIKVIRTEMATIDDDDNELREALDLITCFGVESHQAMVFGTKKALDSFSSEIVYKFWKTYYTAKNSVLCICGNCDNVRELAEKYFSTMQSTEVCVENSKTFVGKHYQAGSTNDFMRLHLIFGIKQENIIAAEVLAKILGGGFNSRLFCLLRNKNSLVYSVNTYVASYFYGKMFYISTNCLSKNFSAITKLVCQEIVKIRKNNVSDIELERAKNELITEWLLLEETPDELCEYYAAEFLKKDFSSIEQKIYQLEKINADDVKHVAQQILKSKPTYGVIGNSKCFYDYDDIMKILEV